jgi:outer membrane protein assembly factor BamB
VIFAAEPPATWPQFLGANRNGISTETGLIDEFASSGPKVLWRVQGGKGMSGMALDDMQAVTMLERDGQQVVVAFDIKDGTELWSESIADGYRNPMGAGPRATPTIADGSIFVFTGEGILAAFDQKSGKLRWQHNVVADFDGKPAEYGMACSPLVVDGLVVVTAGVEGAAVVAYDVKAGQLAWQTGNDTAGYSSPAVLMVGGRRQIVAFTGQSVMGLDPKTGAELWRYEYLTDFDCNIATPIAVGDDVFISSGENHGCARLALQPDGDGFEVSEVWTSFGPKSVMRNEWQTSILLDGYLYGMDNVGGAGPITNLNCVDAKTGERVWQQPRFGKGNLIAADGKLYVVTIDGDLVIVRATPERFEELARAEVCEGTRQAPALLDGRLYLRDAKEVICIDLRK